MQALPAIAAGLDGQIGSGWHTAACRRAFTQRTSGTISWASQMASELMAESGVNFRRFRTEGWNLGAGQTQGWFGINAIFDEPLVIIGPIFLRNDGVEPLPNLAKSWEWQEDGKVLIMHLIEAPNGRTATPLTLTT